MIAVLKLLCCPVRSGKSRTDEKIPGRLLEGARATYLRSGTPDVLSGPVRLRAFTKELTPKQPTNRQMPKHHLAAPELARHQKTI